MWSPAAVRPALLPGTHSHRIAGGTPAATWWPQLAFQLDLPWASGNDCVASLLLVAGSLPALNAAQELQNWKLSAGLGKTEAGSFFTACDILVAYPYKGMPDYSLPPLIIPWISSISFRYYVTILKFLWSCYLFHRKCPPSRSVCANTWATVGLVSIFTVFLISDIFVPPGCAGIIVWDLNESTTAFSQAPW